MAVLIKYTNVLNNMTVLIKYTDVLNNMTVLIKYTDVFVLLITSSESITVIKLSLERYLTSVNISHKLNSSWTDESILMKLYTVVVYDLKKCIKEFPNYFKGDN